ncbi:TerY toxicity protection protein contains von Willebrand factor domain protein [Pyrenophora tritici-repentis]|nr:TerY toxicity protection protein contains von Willebrand factor domain protein [Pyrenophora tritici-repentis]PZD23926.1 von Willebrand factor [Pyrenophora tritici-repentis]
MFIKVKERCSKLKSWTSSSDKRLHSSLATHQQHHSNMNSEPIGEAPPVYTPGPVGKAAFNQPSSASTTSDNDLYAFLKTFDTVFLIDDSGSMAGRSWRETQEALETITPICTSHDEDGIDIYFLNHPDSSLYKSITQASTIIEIFQTVRPRGATPTGQRLNKILTPYLQRYEKNDKTKPMNTIVITDGEPSDDVESAIIQAARKLDKLDAPTWQVGIQFFQVGREPGAREHLKQLDDGLAELAKDDDLRDIVDTVPFTGTGDEKLTATGIMKVVLGSVNRRLDRTSMELHR